MGSMFTYKCPSASEGCSLQLPSDPVFRIEFAADRACNYVTWARYLPISSSRRSHNAHVITVKVKSWPRGSIWVFRSCLASPHLQTFNWMYSYKQVAVRIVDSAIAVFRLVDNNFILSSSLFRLFTDLITNSIRLQTQPVTPVLIYSQTPSQRQLCPFPDVVFPSCHWYITSSRPHCAVHCMLVLAS